MVKVSNKAEVIAGVTTASGNAKIRTSNGDDLAIIAVDKGAIISAVFTQNAFCAAPVTIARQHIKQGNIRLLLINSGNANAGLGKDGELACLASCESLASLAKCEVSAILPFSTGVIGEQLPHDRICEAMPALYSKLAVNNWQQVANAIRTTDTVEKIASCKFSWNGNVVTITGIAKGSGMICPNMATMLAFIATDIEAEQGVLDDCFKSLVEQTFNAITVDGDTSTNDACVLIATGKCGVSLSEDNVELQQLFQQNLQAVMLSLAQAIIRDGEGATKFVKIEVTEGMNSKECKQMAYTIANSPLVKTALFAEDANWGRILAAIGRSGIDDLDISLVSLWIGDVCIIDGGKKVDNYQEASVSKLMEASDINLKVALGRGKSKAVVWTNDLSYDYIKINAEYRS